jgi:hypothetical protein
MLHFLPTFLEHPVEPRWLRLGRLLARVEGGIGKDCREAEENSDKRQLEFHRISFAELPADLNRPEISYYNQ